MTEKEKALIIAYGAEIVEKAMNRTELRELCRYNGIHYNLRTNKYRMARDLCKFWVRNRNYQQIKEIVERGRDHWQERIDVRDRHKPGYFKAMLEKSLYILQKLEEVV